MLYSGEHAEQVAAGKNTTQSNANFINNIRKYLDK